MPSAEVRRLMPLSDGERDIATLDAKTGIGEVAAIAMMNRIGANAPPLV